MKATWWRFVVGAALPLVASAFVLTANAEPAHAAPLHILNLALIGPGVSCTEALAKGANTVTSAVADGSQGIVLCAHVEDAATNTDQGGIPVVFTASVGTVGATGTTKSTTVLTSASGVTSISYRGAGIVAGNDTILATYLQGGAAATESLTLTAATGRSPGAMKLTTRPVAFAPSVTDRLPQYVSPTSGALVSLQVVEADGKLGVDNQTVLLTVDRGAVVAVPGFSMSVSVACAGASSKSLALITASSNLSAPNGQAAAGTINIAICGDQGNAAGKITLTAENVSTPMANVLATFTQSGRPATIEATASGTTITAKAADADGNPVADGTPVRFVLPANAGAMSRGCALTVNGAATSVAALATGSGTVLVTSDYNELGSASTCSAPGARQASASASVGDAGAGSAGAGGRALSSTIPAGGGLGFIVFAGGSVDQLLVASSCPPAAAAVYATVAGEFLPYIAGAPAVVNASFLAAFPSNIPAGTAFLGRCR